jgi:membrane-associated phospholipid phosphatase
MVPVALLAGRPVRFLADWAPFIAVFLGWEAMRGFAGKAGFPIHMQDLANLERTFFGGHIPSAVLQSWFADSRPLVIAATVVYFSHFVVPIGTGLVLWLRDRRQYLRYVVALMSMAFAAFVFFVLLPTAPPWYANDHGAITGVAKLLRTSLPSSISPYYQALNPNEVAAFPSLHAAFPFLSFLALRKMFPRGSYAMLVWCVAVWFSIVFLGEHYVVDAAAGVFLATLAWVVTVRVISPRVALLREPDAAD